MIVTARELRNSQIEEKLKKLGYNKVMVSSTQGRWHNNYEILFDGFRFKLSELLSGCGVMLFHGYNYYSSIMDYEQSVKGLKYIFSLHKAHYITTIGSYNQAEGESRHKKFRDFLALLGFRKLIEYDNLQHIFSCTNVIDKQELWIYINDIDSLNRM